jgi:hypothetical protein
MYIINNLFRRRKYSPDADRQTAEATSETPTFTTPSFAQTRHPYAIGYLSDLIETQGLRQVDFRYVEEHKPNLKDSFRDKNKCYTMHTFYDSDGRRHIGGYLVKDGDNYYVVGPSGGSTKYGLLQDFEEI